MNATLPERLEHPDLAASPLRARDAAPLIDKAVSWRAILAGAAGAAALSLILLVLGTGLGLSAVSPWAQAGMGAAAFGVSTILWITLTQLAASGLGGYLAGRLRGSWQSASADEGYFRDTAHGFLAWAVATLATAALLSSAIGNVLGTGVQAGAAAATAAATVGATAVAGGAGGAAAPAAADPHYEVSALFRAPAAVNPSTAPVGSAATPAELAEVVSIFAHSGRAAALPAEDQRYVAQLVAQRAGVDTQEAERRVAAGYTRLQAQLQAAEARTREAADKARKATAYGALWLFISLLGGAFVASLAATFGGRQRDAMPVA